MIPAGRLALQHSHRGGGIRQGARDTVAVVESGNRRGGRVDRCDSHIGEWKTAHRGGQGEKRRHGRRRGGDELVLLAIGVGARRTPRRVDVTSESGGDREGLTEGNRREHERRQQAANRVVGGRRRREGGGGGPGRFGVDRIQVRVENRNRCVGEVVV